MPPKQQIRRKKGKSGKGALTTSSFPTTATICVRQPSFKLQQGTSGTGALTNNLSGITITNATNVRINPYTLGSRTALLAALFTQWRVKRMIIQYIPDETTSGVLDQPQGAITASVSYGNRAFAMGWYKDPSVTPTTADYVLEFGGRDGNTTRGMNLVVPSSNWLWVETTSASPSAIDIRESSHGSLCAIFRSTSTTTATTYGRVDISAELEFRFPEDSSVIGVDVLSKIMVNRAMAARASIDSDEKVASPSNPTTATPSASKGRGDLRGLPLNAPEQARLRGDPTTGSGGWFNYSS